MQRVKLGLAYLLCLSLIGTASAQPAMESDLGIATLDDYSGGMSYGGAYFDVRTMTGDGIGYRNGYTQLGAVLPIWVTEDMYIAPNSRLLITDNSEIGANVGGMVRRYDINRDRIFGGYAYYDRDHSVEGFDYSQVMFGLETMGERFDMRFNAYFPTNTDQNFVQALSLGTDPIFFGNRLGFVGIGLFQQAVKGADFEIGAPLTKRTPWLRGFVGAYAYSGDNDDPVGVKARIEAWVSDDLSVGVNMNSDSNFGTNVNAVVDFRFAGWKPTRYFPNWTTRERMMMPVQRNWRVATSNTEEEVQVAGINPRDGQPYFVVHIDASNPNQGDGTFENPYNYLPASAPEADLILVQRDGTSLLNPLTGSITLVDYQRFLGEGRAHQADIIGQFGNITTQGTYTLPGFMDDGNYPFLSSNGNIVTLANNNEVSAFNFVNATGFAVTNTVAGSNNFNLNHLNITGNGGGIFLQNATGTGILDEINALNNVAGGISIESGPTPLNLTATNIVSSSLPAGVQAFGMQLTADTGTINATLSNVMLNRNTDGLLLTGNNGDLNVAVTNASIDDSTNDGIRIIGTNSNVNLGLSVATVNRSGGEGLEADMTNGSLAILGRNVTVNNSAADNVNLDLTNTDMNIDFRNAIFNDSITGSGFVLTNTGGSGGGTLSLENVTATENALDGLFLSGDNFTNIDAVVRTSIFSNNGRDAFAVSSDNNANVDLTIAGVQATSSGRHGLNFSATGNAVLNIDVALTNFNDSGLIEPNYVNGNGVNGFANNATVDLTMVGTTASQAADNGLSLLAQNNADVSISVITGNFQNSGQNGLGTGDAVNLVTETGADVSLLISNTPMNNTVAVPGGTQDDGLSIDSSTGSTVLANISGSNLSNNLSNAIQALVDTDASVTVNLLNVIATDSGSDGVLFNVQTNGSFALNSQNSNFDRSGASGTGNGLNGFVRSGGDVSMTWSATTAANSAENGLLLDISGAGSTFNANISGGSFSNSGQALLGVGQQDALHIIAADQSSTSITLTSTSTHNSNPVPLGTQQRGLFATVDTDADLVFNNTGGNMSNNLLNAIDITVANAGSTAALNLNNTTSTGSGQDGFLFNVTDSALMTASFTSSSLSNSGVSGTTDTDFFDGIDGTLDTSAVVRLDFVNSAITNAYHDAVRIDASNLSSFEATFDNSPLDNAGTNVVFNGTENGGNAFRLTFDSGATADTDTDGDGFAGITLLNGSTATNAGDDAVFISATDDGTAVVFNAIDSDFSDSGINASTGGGNGIRALVSVDASVELNIEGTPITNTTPFLPQQRGLFFDVNTGGQLAANFTNSDLSNHFLEGINGNVDGFGNLDSSALVTLSGTTVDSNGSFGAVFNVTNRGDLTLLTSNGSSISNNAAAGVFVNVDGADSTYTFDFSDTTIDGNGLLLGGDGMTILADNTAAVVGASNNLSISGNANAGLTLLLDNASTADLGVATAGLVDTRIDNNGNEGIYALVQNGSELDLNMAFDTLGSSVSGNGLAGTIGNLTDSYDNVRVQASGGSDVEVQFVQTIADGSTRNGFNFIAEDSIFLAQIRAGTSGSNNLGGSGLRFVASGATTQAVLYMDENSADGLLTATNTFDNNGTDPALINTPADPLDGFPQAGAGIFFQATNVDVAAARISASASNNGNPAEAVLTRDVDGDGDGDDDGVYVSINTANQAAVEFVDMGSISGNADAAIDLQLNNIVLLDTVTQPSEITPPEVVIGVGGPGILIEGVTADGDGSGIDISLTNTDLNGNDIIFRNNTITNNTTGHGISLTTNNVTNVDEVIFDTNTLTGNGLDGIHLDFTNTDIASMLFDSNTISGNGVALTDGDGIGFDVVNNTSIGGTITFTNNTIDNNQFDGVSFDNVSNATGLWDLAFDSNTSISGNQGRGINVIVPDALSDVNIVLTNNVINGNALDGVNLDVGADNSLTATSVYGNTIGTGGNGNGGMGIRVVAENNSDVTFNLGDTAQGQNQIGGNTGAGVGMQLIGAGQANIVVENTAITGTLAGADPDFNGDGFSLRLIGGRIANNLQIGDPSVLVSNTQFNGNANDGVSIFLTGTSQLLNPRIESIVATGNGTTTANGAGVRISREGTAILDNAVIQNNMLSTNDDGLAILAASTATVDEYTIFNNMITNNNNRGVVLTARADSGITIDMQQNTITGNVNGQGIQMTEEINAPTDLRDISGQIINNIIDNNGAQGIQVSARHGNNGGLLIQDNLIRNNGLTAAATSGDGIEINRLGTSTIELNTITDNRGSGININPGNNTALNIDYGGTTITTIQDNDISRNRLKGIEFNVGNNDQVNAVVLGNTITFNTIDGIEIVSEGLANVQIGNSVGGVPVATDVNLITDNGGRGIDILVRGSAFNGGDADIGIDGNMILRNGGEGVYVVNTAAQTQDSDAASNLALATTTDINQAPRLALRMDGNLVQDNGSASTFDTTGLVIRVGTSTAFNFLGAFADDGGFASNGLGGDNLFTLADSTGRGGVMAQITNNTFLGAFGNDVTFQSFISTSASGSTSGGIDGSTLGTMATTTGTWTDQNEAVRNNANDLFDTDTFVQDPLARLDLVFTGNSAVSGNLTRAGAAYNNAEGVFKSRTQNNDTATDAPVGGADDNGPFADNAAARRRNAQRLAARDVANAPAGSQLAPLLTITGTGGTPGTSDDFLYAGMGTSTFRVNQSANTFSGSVDGFFTDGFPYDQTNDAAGVGFQGINLFGELPFGWSLLP